MWEISYVLKLLLTWQSFPNADGSFPLFSHLLLSEPLVKFIKGFIDIFKSNILLLAFIFRSNWRLPGKFRLEVMYQCLSHFAWPWRRWASRFSCIPILFLELVPSQTFENVWTVRLQAQKENVPPLQHVELQLEVTTATASVSTIASGRFSHQDKSSRYPFENGPRGLEVLLAVIDELNYLSTSLPLLSRPQMCVIAFEWPTLNVRNGKLATQRWRESAIRVVTVLWTGRDVLKRPYIGDKR